MTDIERVDTLPDRRHHIPEVLADHTLWVCFLDQEGYETFVTAKYSGGEIIISDHAAVPKQAEVSTIQFQLDDKQVTVLPTGYSDDGSLLYMTVEALLEHGEVPAFAAQSLAKRLKKQPYRNKPEVAIYSLLQLLPADQK